MLGQLYEIPSEGKSVFSHYRRRAWALMDSKFQFQFQRVKLNGND